MKYLRNSVAIRGRRAVEKRKSVAGGFRTFSRDIFNQRLLTPHVEMEAVSDAMDNNTFFESATETSTNFIMGEYFEFSSEDKFSKKMVEEYWNSLQGDLAFRNAIKSTIALGNGYIEKDFYDLNMTGGLLVPSQVYAVADASQIYINSDEYGNPLKKKVIGLSHQGAKEVDNNEEFYIQKIFRTFKHPGAKDYKLSYYGSGSQTYSGQIMTIFGVPIDKRKITHFKLNVGRTGLYGRSQLASAINDHEMLFEIERALAVIAKYKAVPRKFIQYGNENLPATDDELDDLVVYLESLDKEDDVILNKPIAATDMSYAGKDIKLDYAIQHIKRKMIAGISLDFLSGMGQDVNRACYTEDTEVLTENGWKLHSDWKEGEKIATFDTKTKRTVLMSPLKLHSYDVKEEIIRFVSNGQDIAVTPEHTMYCRTSNKSEFGIKKANEIEDYKYLEFKTGADNWEGSQTEYSNEYLKFIGIAISEGGLSTAHKKRNSYMMTLAQSYDKNPDKVVVIRDILKKLNFSYSEYKDEKDKCTRWNVYRKKDLMYLYENIGCYCNEKKIPREMLNLNKEKLKFLFDGLMLGDGSWDNRENRECGSYTTVSEQLANDFQELAFKLGYGTKLSVHYEACGNRQKAYRILIRKNNIRGVKTAFREDYEGKVYCFNTTTGFYVTRRNGCVSIQGNTAQQELLAFILAIYSKRRIFLRMIQEEFIDPFIKWKKLKPVKVEFPTLDFETKTERESRIRSNWATNMVTFNEMREDMGLPKFDGDRKSDDVGEMLFGELQSSMLPDMGGGFDFGSEPEPVGMGGSDLNIGGEGEAPSSTIPPDSSASSYSSTESLKDNPTGTKYLQDRMAIGIRKVFNNRLKYIMNQLQANKKTLERRITTESTLGIEGVELIMHGLAGVSSEMRPIINQIIAASWMKSNMDIASQIGIGGRMIPFDKRILEAMGKNSLGFINKYAIGQEAALRLSLTNGITQGDSISSISAEIRDHFKLTSGKSEEIARTEVMKAYNEGAKTSMTNAGVRRYKWLTARDERVRNKEFKDGHRLLNGRIFEHGKRGTISFKQGGKLYQIPASPIPGQLGAPELDINCRCAIRAVIDIPKEKFKKSLRARERFEKRVTYRQMITTFASVFEEPRQELVFYKKAGEGYEVSFLNEDILIHCKVGINDLIENSLIKEVTDEVKEGLWKQFETAYLFKAIDEGDTKSTKEALSPFEKRITYKQMINNFVKMFDEPRFEQVYFKKLEDGYEVSFQYKVLLMTCKITIFDLIEDSRLKGEDINAEVIQALWKAFEARYLIKAIREAGD